MPELPEVETVVKGLQKQLVNQRIKRVEVITPQLRFPVPPSLKRIFTASHIHDITRRAKYILIHTDKGILLNHLGMTGTWREDVSEKKHDHFKLYLESGKCLVYNDPRRFGYIDYFDPKQSCHWLEHLGPEPLDKKSFNKDYLLSRLKTSRSPIKTFIMNQKNVVGVGNIYASEALFMANINPLRPSDKIKKQEAEALIDSIQKVLRRAIKKGGSTIRDFKSAGGSQGYFQMEFKVYGREGLPCSFCGRPIKQLKIGQRSSFYCSKCQK